MLLLFIKDALVASLIAMGFSMIFNTPKRAVWVAGLLGGIGHGIRFVLHEEGILNLLGATLVGAITIGIIAILFAHVVRTPPVVFSMPACITMIPGLFAYRAMLGFIKISNPDYKQLEPSFLLDTMHNMFFAIAILFALAVGVSSVVLIFRKKSAKELNWKIWLRNNLNHLMTRIFR